MGLFHRIRNLTGAAPGLVAELRRGERTGDYFPFIRRLALLYRENADMLNLSIDSENKQIEIEVHLKGQDKPLKIVAREYRIFNEGPARYIQLNGIETSAGWMNTVLRTFDLGQKKIELPPKYAELIELAL